VLEAASWRVAAFIPAAITSNTVLQQYQLLASLLVLARNSTEEEILLLAYRGAWDLSHLCKVRDSLFLRYRHPDRVAAQSGN